MTTFERQSGHPSHAQTRRRHDARARNRPDLAVRRRHRRLRVPSWHGGTAPTLRQPKGSLRRDDMSPTLASSPGGITIAFQQSLMPPSVDGRSHTQIPSRCRDFLNSAISRRYSNRNPEQACGQMRGEQKSASSSLLESFGGRSTYCLATQRASNAAVTVRGLPYSKQFR